MSSIALDEYAGSILNAAVAGLALATTGRAPPGSSWVSHGPPALEHCCDDGQVTVHLDRLEVQPPEADTGVQIPCAIVFVAHYVITLARCVPVLGDSMTETAVPAADLDIAAGDLLEDLWALVTELRDRIRANTLIVETNCRDVRLDDATPLDESGGCAGWLVPLSVRVNDAGPTGS